jgi:putative ABC transport system permease protein
VPLVGKIFPRVDGSAWDFEVTGIYRSKSPNFNEQTMFFHFDYLREALEQHAAFGGEGVGVYKVRIAPGARAEPVMAAIDDLFRNGPQRVQTTTEAEFNRQFVSMMGNVPLLLRAIGGGVLFAIFFAVLNTMLMAARERTRDAGIMKALGFGNGVLTALLVAEALVLSLGGAGIGTLLAKGAEMGLGRFLKPMAPGFAIDGGVLGQGLCIAVAIGVVSGLLPGLRLARLQPVTALRSEA